LGKLGDIGTSDCSSVELKEGTIVSRECRGEKDKRGSAGRARLDGEQLLGNFCGKKRAPEAGPHWA